MSQPWSPDTWTPMCLYLHTDYILYKKNQCKVDYRSKCRMKSYRTPRKNIRENLDDLGFGYDFLDIPIDQSMKEIFNTPSIPQ